MVVDGCVVFSCLLMDVVGWGWLLWVVVVRVCVVARSWHMLAFVGCCWLELFVAGCCWLLPVVVNGYVLSIVVGCCCPVLVVVGWCWWYLVGVWMLAYVGCHWQLLAVVCCCWLLLAVVGCCWLLLVTACRWLPLTFWLLLTAGWCQLLLVTVSGWMLVAAPLGCCGRQCRCSISDAGISFSRSRSNASYSGGCGGALPPA